MRLFRRKSDQPAKQEYLDGLINSIRQARREELENAGLHSFADDEYYPGDEPAGAPNMPPGVARGGGAPDASVVDGAEAEAVANLEAYLSALNAAEAEQKAGAEEDESSQNDESY